MYKFSMIEVYKYLNGHSPDIIKRENVYNLRNVDIFQTENACSLKYRLDAIPYHANQPW